MPFGPGKGMGSVVDTGKGIEIKMGISLGRRDTAVSEQLLHCTQIRSTFKKMRGKGMAQIMRGHMLRNTRELGLHRQYARCLATIQARPPSSQKQGLLSGLRRYAGPHGKPP